MSKHVRKHIVQFQVGNGKTVLGAILFPREYIGEFDAIAHQVAQLADIRRWDKAGLDHAAHIQVTDPLGVLSVGLVPFLGFDVLEVGQGDPIGLFRILNTGIQYLPVDSIQTSKQKYLASQSAKSCKPLESEEKRACLCSAPLLESVIPKQAKIQVL